MLWLVAMLAGCAVGPDFEKPAAPSADAYRIGEGTPGERRSTDIELRRQMFDRAGEVRADWYAIFKSDKLDGLIRRALADNPTLAAGRARLEAAREQVNVSKADLYPRIDASAGIQHERASGISFGIDDPMFVNVFDLYQGRASASYDVDLFGKTRRRIERSRASLDQRRYQVLDTYVTLINNIVVTAIAEAGINASIRASQNVVEAQRKTLAIVGKQVQYGAAIDADASQIRTRLARTRASIEPLRKQRALAVNRLATLVGSAPGSFSDPQFTLAELTLPERLPVSVPGQLVEQRPDILAAQSVLHAASAQVGIATANMLPDLTLSGFYGRSALSAGDLTDPVNALYSIGARLAAPIFEGGRLRARKHAAQDEYTAALADYRATVLAAFGQVANRLRSLESDARALADQKHALAAARNNLDTAHIRVRHGVADYISLYTAESQYQNALLDYTNARVTRYRDSAGLFRALGGGWWNTGGSPLAAAVNSNAHHAADE